MNNLSRRTTLSGCIGLSLSPLFSQPLSAAVENWSATVTKIMSSVVRITPLDNDGVPDDDRGHGSGFIAHEGGWILTNGHVVVNRTSVQVEFADGRTAIAQVVASDMIVDLAVLRLSSQVNVPKPLKLNLDRTTSIGMPVIAIGSPLDYAFSVTAGVISGLDRAFTDTQAIFVVQHDAALNPGNSGGPLVDMSGQVVGINVATPNETQYDIGIAFAIDPTIADRFLKSVISTGHYSRSTLGARVRPIDKSLQKLLGRSERGGLLVEKVEPDSAAARAMMQVGDIIVALNGSQLPRLLPLSRTLWMNPPGAILKLGVERPIELTTLELKTEIARESGSRPETHIRKQRAESDVADLGVELGNKDRHDGVSVVSVDSVTNGGRAQIAGLQAGDIVLQINRAPLRDAMAAEALLRDRSQRQFLLLIARDGAEQQYISLDRGDDDVVRTSTFGVYI